MAWLSKWVTDEWKNAWKWLNVQLAALLVAAPVIYAQFQTLQEYIPHNVFRYGMSALGLLILINTLRKKTPEPPAQ